MEQLDLIVTAPIEGKRRGEGASWVERTMRAFVGPKVVVRLTDNRSTMISYRWQRGVLYLRLHRAFASAPGEVLAAVAAFAGAGRYTAKKGQVIDRFIDAVAPYERRVRSVVARPRGAHHDLQRALDRLNAEYFKGTIRASITWARRTSTRGRRRSIRLGTYIDDLSLIRIHPALDQAFVPEFYVDSVVFHEMLHQRHGVMRSKSGRRVIHSPAFLAEERSFAFYEAARAWEAEHLSRLLRS